MRTLRGEQALLGSRDKEGKWVTSIQDSEPLIGGGESQSYRFLTAPQNWNF